MKMSKLQIKELNELVNDRYIKKSNHHTLNLSIYKYTEKCTFEENWNDITLMCRGLVLDSDYNIVMNCIPKFFNHNEPLAPKHYETGYVVYDKLDGCLIQIARLANGIILISSSGSLDTTSPYIELATKLMHKQEIDKHIECGYTYIFEMISPLSRVVVNYGDEESLNLITIRENDGGKEFLRISPEFKTIQPLNIDKIDLDDLKDSDFKNKEGFVLKFKNGDRVKMKYNSYKTLHKTISQLSEKFIIECMRDNLPIENVLQSIPDEYYNYVKDIQHKVLYAEKIITEFIDNTIKYLSESNWDRKQKAKFIIDNVKDFSGMLFNALDGKNNRLHIFNKILELIEFYNKYNDNMNSFEKFINDSFKLREIK